MAPNRTTVLSVGANAELVRLREYVLQDAGFEVRSTLHAEDALAAIHRGECRVLLMCYSLSTDVRRKLVHALRESCPGSRSVVIANERMEKPEFADTFIYGVEGPEALIQAVASAAGA